MTRYDFLHFVLELKLISGDWMQILPDGISELLNTYKKSTDLQSNDGYPVAPFTNMV